MRFLKSFGRFWYEFIIGDDWKVAAAVVLALLALFGAVAGGIAGDHGLTVLGGALIVLFFTVGFLIDVRSHGRR